MPAVPVSSIQTTSKLLSRLAVVTVLLVALAPAVTAHEVPNEVSVFGFVRPEGRTLRLLIRAPLKSMRDVDIPTQPNGYLDFTRMEPAERRACGRDDDDWIVCHGGCSSLAPRQPGDDTSGASRNSP